MILNKYMYPYIRMISHHSQLCIPLTCHILCMHIYIYVHSMYAYVYRHTYIIILITFLILVLITYWVQINNHTRKYRNKSTNKYVKIHIKIGKWIIKRMPWIFTSPLVFSHSLGCQCSGSCPNSIRRRSLGVWGDLIGFSPSVHGGWGKRGRNPMVSTFLKHIFWSCWHFFIVHMPN